MNHLDILKNMLPLYHIRKNIECTTVVGDYLCTLGGNELSVYYNKNRDYGRLMVASDVHRTKFHNVSIRFYTSDINKTFSVLKKNNHTVLFVAGNSSYNNLQVIDMNVDRDMFFNLSMQMDISLSYEEFKELCKLCSQINHNMAFFLR